MTWALAIILFALVSIGDGNISTSHWAFRCYDGIVLMDSAGIVSKLSEVECEEVVKLKGRS